MQPFGNNAVASSFSKIHKKNQYNADYGNEKADLNKMQFHRWCLTFSQGEHQRHNNTNNHLRNR